MMKYLILILLQLGCIDTFAQESAHNYSRILSYGLAAHNRGALIRANWAWGETAWKKAVGVEIASLQGAKELRLRTQYMDLKEGSRYVPNKINRCLLINPTFGFTRAIFPKNSYNKIETTVGISTGLALALLRPYYLNVFVPSPLNPNTGIIIEDIANSDKYPYSIVVGEVNPFFNMASKAIYPGLSFQAFSYLNLNRRSNFIRAIELSANVYVFTKKIPIMQYATNSNTMITLGIGFTQGHFFP